MAGKKPKFKFTTEYRAADKPFHFYASSGLEWRTSENLDQLITDMKAAGYLFNLWYVPLPEASSYRIHQFAPEVDGTVFLGTYEIVEGK